MTPSLTQLPVRVRALVTTTGALGAVLSGVAWIQFVQHPMSGPLAWVGVAAIVLVGDVSLLRLRFGSNNNSFTWMEAGLVVGAALGGWACLVALLGPVVLGRQLLMRRPWHKAVFNAASVVISGTLARLAYRAVTGQWSHVPHPLDWRAAAGLALASVVYFLSVGILVSAAVASAQGLGFRPVWRRGLRLRLAMVVGNVVVGLAAVFVAGQSPEATVALPFVVLALYAAYNNALRTQQERDIWRELHGAPDALSLNRVELPGVVAAVRQRAQLLFGAEVTLLLLQDDDTATPPVPALLEFGTVAGPRRVDVRTAPYAVAAELRACGVSTAALAPMASGGQSLGVLLVGYRTAVRLTRRELQVLVTFAGQTAASVQHARLFEEVDEQRSRLSSIVDNASDGIMLVDAGGVVRAWNAAMHRMTARSEREALGAQLETVLPGRLADGAPLTGTALLRALDLAADDELLARVGGADGRERDISMTVSAVGSDTGHAVVVARDVTAQREAQLAKEDFIATVSHELRTPLTPIKGYLKLLQRPGLWSDTDRRDAVLMILSEQAGQLERLVEDLLSVSRMTHGQFAVELQTADVDDVVARAVRDATAAGGRIIHHERDEQGASAVCDPARLQQVVANLLSNADKYSPAGADVVVAVSVRDEVEVTVTDEGAGVPLEARAAVFEPFHRLGDALTRSTRGTGLGLHIAHQLVQAMGGRIWVDGAPGKGATFHITVPRVPEQRHGLAPQLNGHARDTAHANGDRRPASALA